MLALPWLSAALACFLLHQKVKTWWSLNYNFGQSMTQRDCLTFVLWELNFRFFMVSCSCYSLGNKVGLSSVIVCDIDAVWSISFLFSTTDGGELLKKKSNPVTQYYQHVCPPFFYHSSVHIELCVACFFIGFSWFISMSLQKNLMSLREWGNFSNLNNLLS